MRRTPEGNTSIERKRYKSDAELKQNNMSGNKLFFNTINFLLAAFILFAGFQISTASNPKLKPTLSQIESGFKTIPDSLQTSVYWYWMSDNISKGGVVKIHHVPNCY